MMNINVNDLEFTVPRITFSPGQKTLGDITVNKYLGFKTVDVNRSSGNSYKEKVHYWECICPKCKQTFITTENSLLHGIKSCGCARIEAVKAAYATGKVQFPDRSGANNNLYTHGGTNENLYIKWRELKTRCYNPNCKRYPRYGGRGIKVCDEWLGPNGYANFRQWAYSAGYTEENHENLSIDRINNDGNYEPSNCYFAGLNGNDYHIHQANNMSTNTVVNWGGVDYTITELARHFGLNPDRIFYRLGAGRSLAEAVLAPAFSSGRRGSIEREQYIAEHGEFQQKPDAICPLSFIKYPEINFNDPKLNYYTVEELARIRGIQR